jgi:predicted Zn-dependent protease
VRDPQHSPFGRAFARIIVPLRHEFPHLTLGVVHSEAINASTLSIPNEKGGFMCFTDSLINMLGDEDEIAFVMAHEVGHALDRQQPCPYDKANADARVRASISTSAHTEETAEQRICEKRADEIGFNLFVQAGYSPYAAGGAFGRLEMFSGEVGTGFFDRMAAIGNNHPITPDRIKDMHQMLASYCQLNPHRCQ